LTNTLILVIAIAEIFKTFEVINYYFQSQVMSKFVVQVQLVINFLISLSKIGLVVIHAPLIWFGIIVVIGSVLNGAGFVYAYKAKGKGALRNWSFQKGIARELLRESWPLAL